MTVTPLAARNLFSALVGGEVTLKGGSTSISRANVKTSSPTAIPLRMRTTTMLWVETAMTKAAAMVTSREVAVTEAELVAVAAAVGTVVTVPAAMARTQVMDMAATHSVVVTTAVLAVEVAA